MTATLDEPEDPEAGVRAEASRTGSDDPGGDAGGLIPELSENETPLPLNPQEGTGTTFATSNKARRAAQHQKHQWRIVAGLLLGTAVATAGVGWLAVIVDETAWSRLSSQLAFLLTPFHTLLGIAVGYYFAEQRKNK